MDNQTWEEAYREAGRIASLSQVDGHTADAYNFCVKYGLSYRRAEAYAIRRLNDENECDPIEGLYFWCDILWQLGCRRPKNIK